MGYVKNLQEIRRDVSRLGVDLGLVVAFVFVSLRHPKTLHGGGFGVAVENRIDVFHDVGVDIEEVALVLDRDECALGTVVHCHL